MRAWPDLSWLLSVLQQAKIPAPMMSPSFSCFVSTGIAESGDGRRSFYGNVFRGSGQCAFLEGTEALLTSGGTRLLARPTEQPLNLSCRDYRMPGLYLRSKS